MGGWGLSPQVSSPLASSLKHWDSHANGSTLAPVSTAPQGQDLGTRQLWELREASREQAEAGPAASPALSGRQRSQHPRPAARPGYQSLHV